MVTISCEDAYGNSFEETMKVSLTVDEPLPEVHETAPAGENGNPGKVLLIVLCVLLTAGLVAQHLVLTGKIHKLEEERL